MLSLKARQKNSSLTYHEVLAVYDMNTHLRIQFKTNSAYYATYESFTLDIDKDLIDSVTITF